MLVTKRFIFSSAHRLSGISFSEEEDRAIYGKCASLHGHNYVLEISLKGKPDKQSGMILDFGVFKKIVQEEVISKLDHKNITEDINFFVKLPPTCENIAKWIWIQLIDKFPNGQLYKIILRETDNNWVEYYGD
ncbi:MAG: 6-carboxytetrahydropterin synthase [Candidatus Theseobacter exili]|nr:6-carboxytetrahydropterin synthase [Candidatus Theseobacter exili]